MPIGPALHGLSLRRPKPPCFRARGLAPAGRLALEGSAPEPLQILLHAPSPMLLFCWQKGIWASEQREEKLSRAWSSLINCLAARL